MVAEFDPETAGGLDTGVRQHADDDYLFNSVLFKLLVEVSQERFCDQLSPCSRFTTILVASFILVVPPNDLCLVRTDKCNYT